MKKPQIADYIGFFDGACAPINPNGHMGVGAAIFQADVVLHTHSEYIPESLDNSNNVSEYMAFLWLVEKLSEISNNNTLFIYGDSKLVVSQMTGKWKIKAGRYKEYALKAKAALFELCKNNTVWIEWIPREENWFADDLSKMELNKAVPFLTV